MTPPVELAVDARASTGESPTWCEREQALYWIDIEEPALHRFNPADNFDEVWEMPAEIGAFALCRNGTIIVALRTGLARFDPASQALEPLSSAPYNPLALRFNDGKCDARGRFWIGAMNDPLCAPDGHSANLAGPALYAFSHGEGLQDKQVRAVIANGLAWSPDWRTMYFSDSEKGTISVFDFDIDSAGLSRQRIFAQFRSSDGKPDGAAVDTEGFYWCALYGGGRIARLAPDGTMERDIRLPVSQPTMCAFGDVDYSTLYITSAAHGVTEPQAGGVFRCRPGFRGLPTELFADG
ncbi:SMP-30/gluconolactonase/LRE family protein [Methylocystis sp. Sn-Cys]|uniref:SMP-30/gluconolactonase/LRE family protein n=1 Tax=Methylocystis sp. Sn-Cys TaxID=1701263 RepID=UPI00351C9496